MKIRFIDRSEPGELWIGMVAGVCSGIMCSLVFGLLAGKCIGHNLYSHPIIGISGGATLVAAGVGFASLLAVGGLREFCRHIDTARSP